MKKICVILLFIYKSVCAQVFTIINESSCDLDEKSSFASVGVFIKEEPKHISSHSSESVIVDDGGLYSGTDEYFFGSYFNIICNSENDGVFSLKIGENKYNSYISSNNVSFPSGDFRYAAIVLVDHKK